LRFGHPDSARQTMLANCDFRDGAWKGGPVTTSVTASVTPHQNTTYVTPFQRIFNRLADIRAPEQLAAAAVASLKHEQDSESTHPPLDKRLANLGFTDIPPIDKAQNSAVDQVLSPEALRELPARFDDEWRKRVREWVNVGR
jgi:hypothetical protein